MQLDNLKLKDYFGQFNSLKNVLAIRYTFFKACMGQCNSNELSVNSDIKDQKEKLVKSGIIKDWAFYKTKDNKVSPEENIGENNEQQERLEKEKEEMAYLESKYCAMSLNYFSLENKFRRLCISILSSPYFDGVIILLIFVNSVVLGLQDYAFRKKAQLNGLPQSKFNLISDNLEIFFTVVYTGELIIKIVATGFIFGSNSYLKDPWNWLDFAVVMTSILQTLPTIANLQILRTFRLFKPLKNLSSIKSMKLMVQTLFNSLLQVSNILILDNFFILIFALIGHSLWSGVMHYRCRQTPFPVDGDWKVVEDDYRICGSYHTCEVACGSLFDLYLPDEKGYYKTYNLDPKIDLNRDSVSVLQNFGITNFDNLGSAYLSIFQCTTLEGWTEIMQMIEDGYNIYFAQIFFICCISICTYLLHNLTIAVMLEKYTKNKKLLKQKIETEGDAANEEQSEKEFIQDSDHINNKKVFKLMQEMRQKQTWREKLTILYQQTVYHKKRDEPYPELPRYKFWICRVCLDIVNLPLFNTCSMIWIFANTAILASDRYPEPRPHENLILQTNLVFVILFTVEIFVKLVGMTFAEWRKEFFNLIDLIIVITSYFEIFMSANQTAIVGAVRSIRLVRLVKLAKYSNHTLECLIDSILLTIVQCGNFIVILLLFIYTFSLLGMEIFAGEFLFNKDGKKDLDKGILPRQNYNDITSALITTFQVLIGEKWNEVMYLGYQSCDGNVTKAVLYYFGLVLIGRIILMNLFLAILLGHFNESSNTIRLQLQYKLIKEFNETHKKMFNQKHPLGENTDSDLYRDEGDKGFKMKLHKIKTDMEIYPQDSNATIKRKMEEREKKTNFSIQDSSFDSNYDYEELYKQNKLQYGKSPLQLKRLDILNKRRSKELNEEQNPEQTEVNVDTQRGLIEKQDFKSPQQKETDSKINGFRQRLSLKVETIEAFENAPSETILSVSSKNGTLSNLLESSLFLFHKNSKFRQFMLRLTTNTNMRQENLFKNLQSMHNHDPDDTEDDIEDQDGNLNFKQEELSPISYILKLTVNQKSENRKVNQFQSLSKRISLAQQYQQHADKEELTKFQYLQKKLPFLKWSLNQWFENFIYFIILISIILLTLDNPQNDAVSSKNLSLIDKIITSFFTIEAACRIIALGFFTSSIPGRSGYITQGSNQIDFLVCISSLVLYILDDQSQFALLDKKTLKSFKVLRSLRALRLLRVISHNQSLKLAVISLFGTLPAISYGFVVCLMVVFIYSILGMSLFKGQFYNCFMMSNDEHNQSLINQNLITIYDCINYGGQWERIQTNFDNIQQSLFVLFQIITTEGWLDVMYLSTDMNGKGFVMKQNNTQFNMYSCYFFSFMIVGKMFIMNLFVGIVIDKYNRLKEARKGYSFINKNQKDWLEAEKAMVEIQLNKAFNKPEQKWSLLVYTIINNSHFKKVIYLLILTSVMIECALSFNLEEQYLRVLNLLFYIFTLIYNIELLMRLTSYQWEFFNISKQNAADFIVVLCCNVAFIIEMIYDPQPDHISKIIKLLRISIMLRMIKVLRVISGIRRLLNCLNAILTGVLNVGSLIILMIFIFAIIGMNAFSGVKYQIELNENNNFDSFGMSFMILVRCATGERWQKIMRELALSNKTFFMLNDVNQSIFNHNYPNKWINCVDSQTFEDKQVNGPQQCGTAVAYVFFPVYIVIINIMMLNLLMAVIIDLYHGFMKEFSGTQMNEQPPLTQIVQAWIDFDPMATGWIKLQDVVYLSCVLDEPIGLRNHYETELRETMKLKLEAQKQKGIQIQTNNDRFLVNNQFNLILPFEEALKIMDHMRLPVYLDNSGDYICHFRDVAKRLMRNVFELENSDFVNFLQFYQDKSPEKSKFNVQGLELKHLKLMQRAWCNKYPDLKTRMQVQLYDSGKIFAISYIVKQVEKRFKLKKFHREETEVLNKFANNKTKKDESTEKEPKKSKTEDQPHQKLFSSNNDNEFLKNYIKGCLRQQIRDNEQNKAELKFGQIAHQSKIADSTSIQKKNQDVTQLKDYERSTWWMVDETKNYKMRQWQKNFEFRQQLKQQRLKNKKPSQLQQEQQQEEEKKAMKEDLQSLKNIPKIQQIQSDQKLKFVETLDKHEEMSQSQRPSKRAVKFAQSGSQSLDISPIIQKSQNPSIQLKLQICSPPMSNLHSSQLSASIESDSLSQGQRRHHAQTLNSNFN